MFTQEEIQRLFVQISPYENYMGETLCSVNYVNRVLGLELRPTQRQQDIGDVFRYKLFGFVYFNLQNLFSPPQHHWIE